jgi:hypothetical protein
MYASLSPLSYHSYEKRGKHNKVKNCIKFINNYNPTINLPRLIPAKN